MIAKWACLAVSVIFLLVCSSASLAGGQNKGAALDKPYGVCAGRNFDPAMLDKLKSTHIGWLRRGLGWDRVERVKGQYDWTEYDQFVDQAKAHGFKVMAILLDTAPWATRDKSLANTKQAHKQVPDPKSWNEFVTAAVKHYRGRVDAWEIGNEPNGPSFFEGTLDDFRDVMLNGATAVIQKNDSTTPMVGPAFAASKSFRNGKMSELFAPVLAKNAASPLSAISIHVYGTPAEIIGAGLEARAIMKKAGLGDKQLWLTEFGWNTNNVSEQAQKDKMVAFLNLNSQQHVFDKFFYYRLTDGGKTLTGSRPDMFGILRKDYSAKPILSAM
jgi:hypothetical protein